MGECMQRREHLLPEDPEELPPLLAPLLPPLLLPPGLAPDEPEAREEEEPLGVMSDSAWDSSHKDREYEKNEFFKSEISRVMKRVSSLIYVQVLMQQESFC